MLGGIMSGLKILILEDDEMIGEILAEMLEDMGHSVLGIAETEKKAIALAARNRPEFMICDVTLEEGSGIVAADTICASGIVPHMFVSGDVNRVHKAVPGAIVLEKPFRQNDVEVAIERTLAAFG